MKTLYALTIVLWSAILSIKAQQPVAGIYRDVSDFRNNIIGIPADCQLGKKAVQVSNFFLRPFVYIHTVEGKIKIREDSIYAIRDCEGTIYRIWKQKAYQLIDTGSLQIYSYSYTGTVKVRTARFIRFGQKQMTDYYFSTDDSSEIIPLTQTNIRLALLANKKLDKELITVFPDDISLTTKQGHHFQINQFLSSKNK
jgi:hypothetical protein